MTPAGWNSRVPVDGGAKVPQNDLVGGTAGIVLAAVWAGGQEARTIATTGGEALLAVADTTEAGLDWPMVRDWPGRMPNYSHGTAGIATALAVAGQALGRPDFVDAAVQGARHLLAVGSLDGGGFVVPHTIPTSTRDVEPVTWTWCHGPAGTSYLFAALSHVGVDEVDGLAVTDLRQRCFRSILAAGVPQRLRPGFWDNDGRCCGTAGVGDTLLDAAQDSTDPGQQTALLAAARTMGDALVERAIRDWPGHGGGSSSTARTRRCSRPAPRGCRAPPGSRRTSCGSPAWSRASTRRWSIAPTAGGRSRPGSGPGTPADCGQATPGAEPMVRAASATMPRIQLWAGSDRRSGCHHIAVLIGTIGQSHGTTLTRAT